jgi:HEAT repeat protein
MNKLASTCLAGVICGVAILFFHRNSQDTIPAPIKTGTTKQYADKKHAPSKFAKASSTPVEPFSSKQAHAKKPFFDFMNVKEYNQLNEAYTLTEPMTKLLREGQELKALAEARKLLKHSDRNVRLEVLHTLEWIGLPAASDLATMIDSETDPEIRRAAQDAFWSALDGEENVNLKCELLGVALRSDDSEFRKTAIEELVFMPSRLSFTLLASSFNDPDESLAKLARENALFVSGEKFTTYEQAMKWFEAHKNDLDDK